MHKKYLKPYFLYLILFLVSANSFSGVISFSYDENQNFIRIYYNSQNYFDRSDIGSLINNQPVKKHNPLRIQLHLIMVDCEQRTEDEYGGIWNAIFYPESKRNFYQECQQNTERIRSFVQNTVNASNKVNAHLMHIKGDRFTNNRLLKTHEQDSKC